MSAGACARASRRLDPGTGMSGARRSANRHHRELRNMRVLFDKSHDAAQAEARTEPVDQVRKLYRVVGLREAGLCWRAAFGDERGEPQHVVAEARIDLVADHSEPV